MNFFKRAVLLILAVVATAGVESRGQTTLTWDAAATSGLWEPAANWGGTSPPGSEILVFNNNVQTTMTNDAVNTTRNQIIFNAGATTARTIAGTTANDFAAVGASGPLVQNNSTGAHVINFPIAVGSDNLTVDTVTAPLTFGGAVSGTGTITKTGGLSTGGGVGNLVVSATNSGFTGKWDVQGGIFSINNDAALGVVPASAVADAITLDGGTLANMTNATSGGGFGAGFDLTLAANRGITLGSNGGVISVGYNRTVTINGPISGTGNLTRINSGNLILNGNNTYAGTTTITAGAVQVGSGGTSGSLGAGAVVNNTTLTFNRSDATTVANDISGTGNLVKSGAGTMTMSGSLTYAGTTTINAGEIRISGGNDRLPTGTVLTIANNNTAALDLNGLNQQLAGLTGGGSFGWVLNNAGTPTSVLTLSPAGERAYSGRINGNIRLEVTGGTSLVITNTQRLQNSNSTYSGGTRISGSAIFARGDGALGAVPGALDSDNITLENGGVLLNDNSALNLSANRGILVGTGGGGLMAGFAAGLNVTVNGPITSAVGNTLTVLRDSNIVIFNGDNSGLAGPLDLVPNGRLQIGTGSTTGTLGTGATSLGAGSVLTFNRTGSLTVSSAISGDGAVSTIGAGSVALTGSNTYTGATTVAAGTLLVNGSTDSSILTSVQTGATLGGTGSVGATLIQTGAFHSPGTSPGIQTFTSGLQYDAGSTLTWELFANSTATRGTDYDGIDLTGGTLAVAPGAILALDFGTTAAGSVVDWDDAFWGSDQSWTIVDVSGAGTWNGDLFDTLSVGNDTLGRSLSSVRPNASFSVADVGGDLVLEYAAVPEPALLPLAGLAVAAALGLGGRRRLLGRGL